MQHSSWLNEAKTALIQLLDVPIHALPVQSHGGKRSSTANSQQSPHHYNHLAPPRLWGSGFEGRISGLCSWPWHKPCSRV